MDEKSAYHIKAGLEVVPTHEDDSPKQLYYDGSALPERVPISEKRLNVNHGVAGNDTNKEYIPETQRRMCGLKRRTLLVLVGFILALIIAAAIAGAVACTKFTKQKKEHVPVPPSSGITVPDGATSSAASTSATPTVEPSSTSSAPSSAIATAGSKLEPKYNFTVYQDRNYGGASQYFNTVGTYNLPFWADSYKWLPGNSGCCVRFCGTTNDVGYRCSLETYQTNASQPFNRVVILCSGNSRPDPSLCDKSTSSDGG